MIAKDYIITGAEGMHARPATALVRLVKNFKSVVSLKKGDKTVRLNSLLNILSLMIKGGDTISIIVEGEDEAGAAAAIDLFFNEH
jgi:phosphocarrier protein HPr